MHVASFRLPFFFSPVKSVSSFLWGGQGWINQMLFMLGSTLSPVFCVILSSRAQLTIFLAPLSVLPTLPEISTSHWIFITPSSASSLNLPDSSSHLALHDTTLFFLASTKLSTK